MSAKRPDKANGWFPIGRSDDAVLRHAYHTVLDGTELVVWRADDGFLNVWDNLCLHRGVRLSIGHNEGNELKCAYHGWRYSSRTGGCTYIPAHPANAPAQTMCTKTYPAVEGHGLIWTSLGGPSGSLPPVGIATSEGFPLRSLPFDAPSELVETLLDGYRFSSLDLVEVPTELCSHQGNGFVQIEVVNGATIYLFVQPTGPDHCTVHSFLSDAPAEGAELETYAQHSRALDQVRQLAEQQSAEALPLGTTLVSLVSSPTSTGPRPGAATSQDRLRVAIKKKTVVANEIVSLELAPLDGPLPAVQPGAHIDLYLPDGSFRQYSLVNQSADQQTYVIGVKLEPESRGGSLWVHESSNEGDQIEISSPHNSFVMRRDFTKAILIAGGIGVTPLLSMAATMAADSLPFELHYFARSAEHLAFPDRLANLGDSVVTHLGLSPDETASQLEKLLASPGYANQIYGCGPGPLIESVDRIANAQGWPPESIHFEYFTNDAEIDRSGTFTVELARSGLSLSVNEGESILDVLATAGVAMSRSCEQGACGSCLAGVLDGEPSHQDVYLKGVDRDGGKLIVTCVSRSSSPKLVLDI